MEPFAECIQDKRDLNILAFDRAMPIEYASHKFFSFFSTSFSVALDYTEFGLNYILCIRTLIDWLIDTNMRAQIQRDSPTLIEITTTSTSSLPSFPKWNWFKLDEHTVADALLQQCQRLSTDELFRQTVWRCWFDVHSLELFRMHVSLSVSKWTILIPRLKISATLLIYLPNLRSSKQQCVHSSIATERNFEFQQNNDFNILCSYYFITL